MKLSECIHSSRVISPNLACLEFSIQDYLPRAQALWSPRVHAILLFNILCPSSANLIEAQRDPV